MKHWIWAAFLLAATTATATEMTHPFYLTPKGKIASDTQMAYQKFHVKKMTNGFADYRTRDTVISQNFSYGIAPRVAVEAQISNAWNRLTYDGITTTDKEATNIDWHVGATYDLYRQNDFYAQSRVLYTQKETHHYGEAYKALNGELKGGYDFGFILPYASVFAEIPLAQSKYADNNPKYDVSVGVYNKTGYIAIDTALHYHYDELWESQKWYADTSVYAYVRSNIAVGAFFSYTFEDNGQNNAHGDSHTIGLSVKTEF